MTVGVRKVLETVLEFHAKIAAGSYFVGPELRDALRACGRLEGLGMATTVAYWNALDESPQQVTAAYLGALDALGAAKLEAYLSIKPSFIGFDRGLFNAIVEKSRDTRIALHCDAQGYSEVDDTLAVIAEAGGRALEVGCTLPGRWRRSLADAEWAVNRQIPVRVVKGQLHDPTARDGDHFAQGGLGLRQGFLAVIDRLAGRARRVAVATHDAPLARQAVERLQRANTPCGVELLYGLPLEPVRRVAAELGVAVRIYIPYGHGFLPYWFAQGFKRPEVFWWMLRDFFRAPFQRLPHG